jgi:hypothetical protein
MRLVFKFLMMSLLITKIFVTNVTYAQNPNDQSPINEANAQIMDQKASVLLYGNFSQSTQTKGLIFNENQVKEITPDKSNIIDKNHILVEFTIRAADITSRTSYTAIATDENGRIAVGNTMTMVNEINNLSFVDIPLCPATQADLTMQTQMSLLENLVKVRTESRNNRQAQLRANLTTELIERIKKTEQSFGFSYHKDLTIDSAPYEIVSRLNRVYNSLRNYRIAKGK